MNSAGEVSTQKEEIHEWESNTGRDSCFTLRETILWSPKKALNEKTRAAKNEEGKDRLLIVR